LVGIGTHIVKNSRFESKSIDEERRSHAVSSIHASTSDNDDSDEIDTEIDMSALNLDYDVIINPGRDYKLRAQDVCLYISLVKEKDFHWKDLRRVTGKIGASSSVLCKRILNCFI
jgi:hypothetical protein